MSMLVLFGSRVRGQVHPHSDWDFGYLAGERADIDLLRVRLAQALGTDAIDVVNLARGSALLRMQVSTEGRPLFENEPGLFLRFQDEAARFWCDVEPVLSRAYAYVLQEARSTCAPSLPFWPKRSLPWIDTCGEWQSACPETQASSNL